MGNCEQERALLNGALGQERRGFVRNHKRLENHAVVFPEEISLTRESAGVRAISHGFPLVTQDDHETVEKGGFLYDSLYAGLQKQRTENIAS
jgi:hypothetical protein